MQMLRAQHFTGLVACGKLMAVIGKACQAR